MVIPLAVYHSTEADMVMNHQSKTMVMVTNHHPTEATNLLKDLSIQQLLSSAELEDLRGLVPSLGWWFVTITMVVLWWFINIGRLVTITFQIFAVNLNF